MPAIHRRRAARGSDMIQRKNIDTGSNASILTEQKPSQPLPNNNPKKPTSGYLLISDDGDKDEDEQRSATVDGRDEDCGADGEEEGETGAGYEKEYDYGVKEDGEEDDGGNMGDVEDVEDVDDDDDVNEEVVGEKDNRGRIPADISFSGVFKQKVRVGDIDGLWGWDATAGGYGNASYAGPSKGPQKQVMDKIILGAVMSLADAAAVEAEGEGNVSTGSSGDTSTIAANQFDGEAANESLTAIESMLEGSEDSQYSHEGQRSNLGARLQRNERKIKRAQRKIQKYETEMKYLEQKRRRLIWML